MQNLLMGNRQEPFWLFCITTAKLRFDASKGVETRTADNTFLTAPTNDRSSPYIDSDYLYLVVLTLQGTDGTVPFACLPFHPPPDSSRSHESRSKFPCCSWIRYLLLLVWYLPVLTSWKFSLTDLLSRFADLVRLYKFVGFSYRLWWRWVIGDCDPETRDRDVAGHFFLSGCWKWPFWIRLWKSGPSNWLFMRRNANGTDSSD